MFSSRLHCLCATHLSCWFNDLIALSFWPNCWRRNWISFKWSSSFCFESSASSFLVAVNTTWGVRTYAFFGTSLSSCWDSEESESDSESEPGESSEPKESSGWNVESGFFFQYYFYCLSWWSLASLLGCDVELSSVSGSTSWCAQTGIGRVWEIFAWQVVEEFVGLNGIII